MVCFKYPAIEIVVKPVLINVKSLQAWILSTSRFTTVFLHGSVDSAPNFITFLGNETYDLSVFLYRDWANASVVFLFLVVDFAI